MANFTANSNGQLADVQSKMDNASADPADTTLITMPVGTFEWPITPTDSVNTLNFPAKQIYLQGAVGGGTIVNLNNGSASGGAIVWTLPKNPSARPAAALVARIGNIYFAWPTPAVDATSPGGRRVVGNMVTIKATTDNRDNSRFQMDHCTFETRDRFLTQNVLGVCHDCDFIIKKDSGGNWQTMQDKWNGGDHAHQSHSDPINREFPNDVLNWNTDEFIYLETCNVYADGNHGSINGFGGFTDAFGGARVIVRHCHIYNRWLATHGMDSAGSGTPQGSRGVAIYGKFNNDLYALDSGPTQSRGMSDLRSGIEVAHGNRYHRPSTNTKPTGCIWKLACYRAVSEQFPGVGPADGKSPFDLNDPPNGGIYGSPGGPTPYWSGAATAASAIVQGDIQVATNNSPAWDTTANGGKGQWYGYMAVKTTGIRGPGTPGLSSGNTKGEDWAGVITGNGQFSLNIGPGGIFPAWDVTQYAAGDHIEIRKVSLIDMPGMHGGSPPLTGSLSNTTLTQNWPGGAGHNNQAIVPCLYWDNRVVRDDTGALGDSIGVSDNGWPVIRNGVQYIDYGASGTAPAGWSELIYPHPLAGGAVGPHIISTAWSFINGGTTTQSFPVQVGGFTNPGTVTFSISPAVPPPVDVIFTNATGTFSGTAQHAVSDIYSFTITATATSPSQSAAGPFNLTITSPNKAPTVSITTNGTSFTALADITITATATDPEGQMNRVEFYSGGVLIPGSTQTSPVTPGGTTYQFIWTAVPAGAYSLTAKAWDGAPVPLSTISNQINVTVSQPGPGLAAPTIVVSA